MKLIYSLFFLIFFPLLVNAQQFSFLTDISESVSETSGIIYLNNRLITHNDSGGDNALYELDINDGSLTRTVAINNATNTDWEDITYDDEYIYIADIGNNNGDRTDLKVYRIYISDYLDSDDTATAEVINFSYSDQTDFTTRDLHDFDAEGIISYNDYLYIFTKNKEISSWGTTNIYKLPKSPGTHYISQVDNFDYKESLTDAELITGATYEKTTNKILLTGYIVNTSKEITSSFIVEISNFSSDNFSNGNINRIPINTNGESEQIESITHFTRNKYYLTAEKGSSSSASLHIIENSSTDKYRMMFNNDPSTEVTIGWGQVYGSDPRVCFDTNPNADWDNCPNSIIPYRTVPYLSMNNQFVKLTGLNPDTKYYFVIKDSEGISEQFWFKTVTNNNNERLSIISGGDSRFDTGLVNFDEAVFREYRENSNRLVAKLRPHAVLFGGDLIGSPGRLPDTMAKWFDDWQLTITSDNQIIPVVHSYGNHESDSPDGDLLTLNKLFDTPEDSYYNVKFGGDLFSFYVLNGELLSAGTENDLDKRIAQRNWLLSELVDDSSIWKSAGYHRPISPHNSDKVPSEDSFNDWIDYFYTYGVRLVIESDAHLVKLTQEVRPTSETTTDTGPEDWFETTGIEPDKGISFIGGGSWGIVRDADVSYSYTLAKDSFYAFNWVFIDKDKMEIRTIDTQSPDSITERTEDTRFNIDTDIDNVIWKPSGLTSGVKIILRYKDRTVWDGTWSNGLPDTTMDAVINAEYDGLNGNLEVRDLTINSSLNFDNNTINTVVVSGDLTINEPADFTIGDKESLVMSKDDAVIIGEIIKKENSAIRNNTHDITYWSSPVTEETIESVFFDVSPGRIFYYDQSKSLASDPDDDPDGTYWDVWQTATGIMYPAYGYAAEGKTGETGTDRRVFKGQPNNGNIYYDLKGNFADSDPDNDFNLIGNPYPSAINISDFFDVNQEVIDETVYLWTHATPISNDDSGDFSTSDYATYNREGGTRSSDDGVVPRDTLGSGQGFFVRATTSGQLEFNNSMRRASQNSLFFKNDNVNNKIKDGYKVENRIWLNLMTRQGGFNQILIGFNDNATEGVDKGYDAFKLDSGNPISLYSLINNEKYVIQSLDQFNDEKTIRLGFDTRVSPRIFTVKIDNIEGLIRDKDIYLTDHYLNVVYDLKSSDYQFAQAISGKFPNRFSLKISSSQLSIDEVKADNFTISNTSSGFDIKSTSLVTEIKLYDILGRLVLQNNPDKQNFSLNADHLKPGTLLIVRLTFDNNYNLSKKIIRF
jgi:hypothetical protein